MPLIIMDSTTLLFTEIIMLWPLMERGTVTLISAISPALIVKSSIFNGVGILSKTLMVAMFSKYHS